MTDEQFRQAVQKHATVKNGEYTIPLIGIAPAATKEICSKCGKEVHLSQITFNEKSEPVCSGCANS